MKIITVIKTVASCGKNPPSYSVDNDFFQLPLQLLLKIKAENIKIAARNTHTDVAAGKSSELLRCSITDVAATDVLGPFRATSSGCVRIFLQTKGKQLDLISVKKI